MGATVRLTMAQALVRKLAAQRTTTRDGEVPLFAGVWAIFGHGNVAGMGEALWGVREVLPTYRGHNEQAMAHAAIGFAKASRRRRMMACTSSIGPGALNMVTAAGVAHVNRLPVLLLPGDVFASRRPDPVLQQVEDWGDGTVSANDAFRPVSRYFDRITRAEQIMPALDRALAVLTDPAECGPVTLALCQDVQAEAYDYPLSWFEERDWTPRRVRPDLRELERAAALLRGAARPLVIAGGGVLYGEAEGALAGFLERHRVPAAETQAGKSALASGHPLNLGAVGVTGTAAANRAAAEADVVLALGTRLADFTTGSRTLLRGRVVALNVQAADAGKHGAWPLVADAVAGLAGLSEALGGWRADDGWVARVKSARATWGEVASRYTAASEGGRPTDAEVIGAVQRASQPSDVVVGAAGGLPGELHKLWSAGAVGGYHLEYGFSCMGYEIAGGLGVKMADPAREVIVLVGDGSFLMMNSEIATSVAMGMRLIVVVLDNRGFGCIHRLQGHTGGAAFGNLREAAADFVAIAGGLGAAAEKVDDLSGLEEAIGRARGSERTRVLVIETDPEASTDAGGHWWDVAVPEVSERERVRAARSDYEQHRLLQP